MVDNTHRVEKEEEEKMPVKLIQVKQFECLRCEWKWQPRKEEDPIICPHCKSPYWNKPRRASSDQDDKE